MMKAAPSIRSVARLAGVSAATVSLALRNHPRIRLEVRERIQRIAQEAGYKANPIAAHLLAQLRSSHTAYKNTLGLLYTGSDPALLNDVPTFREWVSGCRDRAAALGYTLDEFSLSAAGMTARRLMKILDTRSIRGLVVIGPFEGNPLLAEMKSVWEQSAAIVIGVRPIEPELTFVSNDQFSTAGQAVRELLKLGYTRPGLCLQAEVDKLVGHRFSGGFLVEQTNLPFENRIPIFDFHHGSETLFRQWLKSSNPDAIVTAHSEIEQALIATGRRAPKDIGLVHLDHSPGMKWAGMDQNNRHIGRAAIDVGSPGTELEFAL